MLTKLTVFLITFFTSMNCQPAWAQQTTNIPRIGYLTIGSRTFTPSRVEAFRQGLRDLGYTDKINILIEWRFADGNSTKQKTYANELVDLNVKVIVTAGPADTRAAKAASKILPIVMAQDPDPVSNGFVASLAHPGGNITGLATVSSEITGKQLELLKEVIPKLSRVAVIGSSNIPGQAQALNETELAAKAIGIEIHYIDVTAAKDIDLAFRTAIKKNSEAALVVGSPVLSINRKQIIQLAAKYKLPATYTRPEFVGAGGLMTYGANYDDLSRRAAIYVDKILKGARPSDLPVEQPTKFEFIVNLKAAEHIGLAIPPNVLARADRVIR